MIPQTILCKAIQKGFKKGFEKFTEGYCVEFALALHKELPTSKILVGSRTYTNGGEDYENPLSHVVIEYKNDTYDVGGKKAIERWEELYINPYDCGGDQDVLFSWDTHTVDELKELVSQQRTSLPYKDSKPLSPKEKDPRKIDKKIQSQVTTILQRELRYQINQEI
jgi:hypothetical protein